MRNMGFMRGLPGRGIASASFATATGITLTFTDGATWSTGPLGAGGGAGEDGRGISGTAYNAATGVLTLTFTDATTYATGDLRGVQGPQGIQGVAGAQGPAGPQGPAGDDGAQGPQGNPGVDGDDGAQGPAGPQGVAGAQGPQGVAGPAGTSAVVIGFATDAAAQAHAAANPADLVYSTEGL